MCPGGWSVCFCHTAYPSLGPSGLCEYLSPLASQNGLHTTFPSSLLSQEHWQEAVLRCYLGDIICSVGYRAPNHDWHISSSLQSPWCKAHLRHGEISVMNQAAHWQRHQSDDSGRTDNKGKERWRSSMEKENGGKKKGRSWNATKGWNLNVKQHEMKKPTHKPWNITQLYIKRNVRERMGKINVKGHGK